MPAADPAAETLLHRIVQQISDGRIISPPDDNAMQTWQSVLQRDIATQRSPEVLKALEDFDTYARARAADERAAGRVLVAAELTVFADQASRMMGRVSPDDSSGTAAASDAASGNTPPVRSDGGTAAPANAAGTRTAQGQSAGPVTDRATADSPSAGTAAVAAGAASGGLSHARSNGAAASATEAATGNNPRGQSADATGSITDAVVQAAPPLQAFGTVAIAADLQGGDARPVRSAGKAGVATDSAGHDVTYDGAADTTALAPTPGAAPVGGSAGTAALATTVATSEAPQIPPSGITTVPVGESPKAASSDTAPAVQIVANGEASQSQASPPTGNTLASPKVPAASLPALPESAMAAFYAARGDAMLAARDISGARKFYEYAADAGSARAATALARTYDPAFAVQLGELGLQPDPALAAVWYRKAAQLGAPAAQLSQSGNTGK